MKELTIHCTIYIPSKEEWSNPEADAEATMSAIQKASENELSFDYQIYDVEVNND